MDSSNAATPGPSAEDPHLGDRINTATRTVHTKLNKQLLLRLPLAVPPRAHTPSTYVSGLIHVAPIYIAFESLWRDILRSHDDKVKQFGDCGPDGCQPGTHPLDPQSLPLFPFGTSETLVHRPVACERIHSVLIYLRLPGLERSSSIRADIRSITGWSKDLVDEQVKVAAKTGRLGEFIAHIQRSIDKNPHVLLAYAWVLYMALFSGGRFIRATLETAGTEFWSKTSEPVQPSMRPCEKPIPVGPRQPRDHGHSHCTTGDAQSSSQETPSLGSLNFFRFATPRDGEDLKTEFKRRLIESESLLTEGEREDIVQEAQCIFDNMILLITQLDGVFDNRSPSNSLDGWASLLVPRLVGGRVRDSIAVAKERGLKALDLGVRSKHDESSPAESDQRLPASEHVNKITVSGDTATTTVASSLNANGTMTSATELAVKMSLSQDADAGTLKTVRFGNTLIRSDRVSHVEEHALSAITDGEAASKLEPIATGASSGVLDEKRGRVWPSSTMLWNVALFLGMVGILLGVGQVRK
ncbi:hypothetical protein B0T22DRAFT_482567 [Podospora appendiculata]|uniref:Heme oxygenase n=1 Tax=Podospora appendiculata TaxID=314037 RepID=A0AAE0X630_9PEZI|nr:hypothetical protein B0T22DRAFT_482567 [Podospora appendiculata]